MDKQKIVNKQFQRAFLGYDVEEVDAFLDEIIREMERADQELGIARLRIRMLLEELENHGLIKCRRGGSAAGQEEPVCEPAQTDAPEEPAPEEAAPVEDAPDDSAPEEPAPEVQAESAAPEAQGEASEANEPQHEQN